MTDVLTHAEAAERELAEVDAALDQSTKCIAKTRAARIMDSFEHTKLVTDAAVFDAEKAEQSVRRQCVHWMEAARLAAKERDALAAKNARLREALDKARQRMHNMRAGDYDDAAFDRWVSAIDDALRAQPGEEVGP